MFDVNDILARLAAGEDIADIAQQAADAINQAKYQYDIQRQKQKEEEELKKRKAAELQKKKEAKALEICSNIFEYGRIAFPDAISESDAAEFMRTVSLKELCEALDTGFGMIQNLGKVEIALNSGDEKEAGDAIAKFLAENGLF